jgi:hypothetical protein
MRRVRLFTLRYHMWDLRTKRVSRSTKIDALVAAVPFGTILPPTVPRWICAMHNQQLWEITVQRRFQEDSDATHFYANLHIFFVDWCEKGSRGNARLFVVIEWFRLDSSSITRNNNSRTINKDKKYVIMVVVAEIAILSLARCG